MEHTTGTTDTGARHDKLSVAVTKQTTFTPLEVISKQPVTNSLTTIVPRATTTASPTKAPVTLNSTPTGKTQSPTLEPTKEPTVATTEAPA